MSDSYSLSVRSECYLCNGTDSWKGPLVLSMSSISCVDKGQLPWSGIWHLPVLFFPKWLKDEELKKLHFWVQLFIVTKVWNTGETGDIDAEAPNPLNKVTTRICLHCLGLPEWWQFQSLSSPQILNYLCNWMQHYPLLAFDKLSYFTLLYC